jgi:predicted AAA+ superfamily ATPase
MEKATKEYQARSTKIARRYIDVLEDTLIVFRVPAWSGSDRASLVAHPKILLFDIGVRNAILRRPRDRPLDDERGLLLEHLVGLELRRREHTIWPEARVQHFRTRRGAEVDFVVSVGRELWAIEVKASRRVDARDLKGFEALAERARKLTRRIVVFLGKRSQRINGIEALPIDDFLAELPS